MIKQSDSGIPSNTLTAFLTKHSILDVRLDSEYHSM